jgi:hypothetical protein
VQGVPVKLSNPSIVARVNGFVLALKPLVPEFQDSGFAPNVPDRVNVSEVIVPPVLFVIPNCTGVPPNEGRTAARSPPVKLNGVDPLHVVAPPQLTNGPITSWGSTIVSAHAALPTPKEAMAPTIPHKSQVFSERDIGSSLRSYEEQSMSQGTYGLFSTGSSSIDL